MTDTLREALDRAAPQQVPDELRLLRAGSAFGLVPRTVKLVIDAVTHIGTLPEAAKARVVLAAYVAAPVDILYLIPDRPEVTPAAGHVSVTAQGDILTAAADAVTSLEVTYLAIEGEVFEDTISAAASVATLLQGRSARLILSATVLTGVVLGAKIIDVRGTAAPALGHASLQETGLTVNFNAGDVVAGNVKIRYIAFPGVGSGTRDPIGTVLDAELGSTLGM